MTKIAFPLNLAYLKYLCDTVRYGGVSAAAKVNYVTQPAISQAINKLEKAVGKPLFERHAHTFKLTPAGSNDL